LKFSKKDLLSSSVISTSEVSLGSSSLPLPIVIGMSTQVNDDPSPFVATTSAVTEAEGAVLWISTTTSAEVGVPAAIGQVTPRSLQKSLVTAKIGKLPNLTTKSRVAPSVTSTVGVASTLIVSVVPGTSGSSENATEVIPRSSVAPAQLRDR